MVVVKATDIFKESAFVMNEKVIITEGIYKKYLGTIINVHRSEETILYEVSVLIDDKKQNLFLSKNSLKKHIPFKIPFFS